MSKLKITITIEEGRVIFHALSEMPFKQVFELIGKINSQTNDQINNNESTNGLLKLVLNELDLELISEALSKQPYEQVYKIISKLFNVETLS